MIQSLPQSCNIISLLPNAADAAGRTSTNYASLKHALKVTVIARVNQGNAATVAFSLLQATAVAGTSSKAGPTASIWTNQDAQGADSFTKQTDAASFTTSAAVKDKTVVFEFSPSAMDVANGFDCIGISTGASHASNITSAMAIIWTGYAQSAPPSALTD